MKNIPLKYAVALAVIIIALISVIVWQANKTTKIAQAPQVSSSVDVQGTTKASAPATVQVIKSPVTTKTSPSLGYADYLTQLRANQSKCENAATAQYKQLYGNLFEASFTSAYNGTSGGCYMRVSGKTQVAYATTSTGHLYFRNVNTNALLAECTDSTGSMLSNSNWACVNKVTGAAISKAEFDGLIYTYTAK
ncbi:MAG TPA: hypothetical protein VL335_02640 [Candidatus Paceibacterota bacterium]|jgi:hypothetical protein|nr:hypothetical protein [Candidatus Paceibacterota bacterium]